MYVFTTSLKLFAIRIYNDNRLFGLHFSLDISFFTLNYMISSPFNFCVITNLYPSIFQYLGEELIRKSHYFDWDHTIRISRRPSFGWYHTIRKSLNIDWLRDSLKIFNHYIDWFRDYFRNRRVSKLIYIVNKKLKCKYQLHF